MKFNRKLNTFFMVLFVGFLGVTIFLTNKAVDVRDAVNNVGVGLVVERIDKNIIYLKSIGNEMFLDKEGMSEEVEKVFDEAVVVLGVGVLNDKILRLEEIRKKLLALDWKVEERNKLEESKREKVILVILSFLAMLGCGIMIMVSL